MMRAFVRVLIAVVLLPWIAVSAGASDLVDSPLVSAAPPELRSASGELGSAGGLYSSLVPARLVETRSGPGLVTVDGLFEGDGPVAGGSLLDVSVVGRGGVPSEGVGAVVVNLGAIRPTQRTFLTVFPNGADRPNAANMNVGAGDVLSNTVIAKVGVDGKISIYNNKGQVHVAVDVLGWFPDSDAFTGVQPARLVETRSGPGLVTVDGLFEGDGPVAGGSSLDVSVVGRGGVPSDGVGAVVVNLGAIRPTQRTFLTVFPNGADRPNAANMNVGAGDVLSNTVIAKVGVDGKISIYNNNGQVHVAVDVLGWFPDSDAFTGVQPARLVETRSGPGLVTVDGLFEGDGPVAGGSLLDVSVVGRGGVPSDGVGAVVVNLGAIRPTQRTFLTVFPNGADRPNAANMNVGAGDVLSNTVIAKVGVDGKISIYNNNGQVHVAVDVLGWFPTSTNDVANDVVIVDDTDSTLTSGGPTTGAATFTIAPNRAADLDIGEVLVTMTDNGPFYGKVTSKSGTSATATEVPLTRVIPNLDLSFTADTATGDIEVAPVPTPSRTS